MAKKKVYAVKKGKNPGIYDSWEECREAVSGYPGAQFRGFSSEQEARAYLGVESRTESGPEEAVGEIPENGLVAYVDGSFDEALGKYSFGCILITPEGEIFRESGNGSQPESLAIRNVAGEMLGAMYAVRWALVNGYTRLYLRYDYEGIEKWATGAWKAKNALTQKYAAYMKRQQAYLQILFEKVKAHTGNYYNEEVDKLAKAALTEADGIPEIVRQRK